MITSTLVRLLTIDPASHPRGQPHISSASGLIVVGDWFYFVADDENHLIALRSADVECGTLRMVPLGNTPLPADYAERKRRKKDLEVLFHVPGDGKRPPLLVAWGSGSRPQRDVAYLLPLYPAGGLAGDAQAVSLTPLHDALRRHTADLNIEAGLVRGNELWLFSRANAGAPLNGCFRIDLAEALEFLQGAEGEVDMPALLFTPLDLGRLGGVPLGVTDATALANGGILLSAVAEDASNAYEDGRCEGTVLVACSADGDVTWTGQLEGDFKAEGLAFDAQGMLWLTTDADDATVASELRRVSWPTNGLC